MRALGVSVALPAVLAATLSGCGVIAKTKPVPEASTPAPPAVAAPHPSPASGARGCQDIPVDSANPGNASAMASQSVGSAIASNSSFSVLRSALVKADLIGSLDDAPALTVFAPNNPAFLKVPARRLQDLAADPKALSLMLKQHVVSGRLSPEQLPGAHRTLAGDELVVTAEGSATTVNGTARVLCANVQTANATIYVIDTVLQSD